MATIAELLQAANRKIAHLEQIKTAMKSAINGSGSTVGDKFADYPPAVTNGRAGIAAAITEKGVQTSADAPFDVLEANVRAIESGMQGYEAYLTIDASRANSYVCVHYFDANLKEYVTIKVEQGAFKSDLKVLTGTDIVVGASSGRDSLNISIGWNFYDAFYQAKIPNEEGIHVYLDVIDT